MNNPFVMLKTETAPEEVLDTVYVGGFAVDSTAQRRLLTLSQKQGAPFALRVGVLGGGCSGFQYEIVVGVLEDTDDCVSFGSSGEASVLVDPVSMPFLDGARLRAESDMLGQRFVIDNPNATSGCGCGVSFSL